MECWHFSCDIYGLSDNTEGTITIHQLFKGSGVFKALRDHEVPIPDGHYTLLEGPHRSHFKRGVVGEITTLGAFRKVAVIDIVSDDSFFHVDPRRVRLVLA